MRKKILSFLLAFQVLTLQQVLCQNETSKWYFGENAGLDFSTNPPTILTNGMVNTQEGCAAISDGTGILLFYTDGVNVWDQTHSLMANSTGLTGDASSSQSSIIAKQPGNTNLYYVFSNSGPAGSGAAYSVIDMNLAAGMGSITVKNVSLSAPTSEKLTSVRHCNGTDIWIIMHDWNSADFKAWLLTSTGLNTTPVVTTIGSIHATSADYAGCMKTSPNGRKLGLALFSSGTFEMFDFNNSTGVVSNSLSLSTTTVYGAYGCEFSPDGTKFYGSTGFAPGNLFQWDLCAGSQSSIVASKTTVFTSTAGLSAMQNASNGKIYIARFYNQETLGVINAPNAPGTACNYVDLGQSIAPKVTAWSIPNFITSFVKTPPFSYTSACKAYTFNPVITHGSGCQSASSVTSVSWNFGDPASGTANTSSLALPQHTFNTPGNYTVTLMRQYACLRNDTVKQTITIPNCTSVKENWQHTLFRMYPNPVNNMMWVENETEIELTLCDLQLRPLLVRKFSAGDHEINISTIPDGVYLIKITSQFGSTVRRFVKQEE